jgi:hypothetical protein
MKYTPIRLLASFVSLFLFISNVADAACTPVVYAFRHAEDLKQGTGLKPIGTEHADRYDGMVAHFELDRSYCPVAYVYSMYNINPNGSPGTENPFQTAEPLAFRACYIKALAENILKPDLACSGSAILAGTLPRMELGNGGKLYEYLGTTPAEQNAKNSATGVQLRAELLSNASTGLSSAIFWTSQGLSTVGEAIAKGANIPPKIEGNGDSGPAKNAVYVFEYSGGLLNPPKNLTKYVQCFNINVNNPTGPPSGTEYYCRKGVGKDRDSASIGNRGDLPDIKDLSALEGHICDTTGLPLVKENYYGPC